MSEIQRKFKFGDVVVFKNGDNPEFGQVIKLLDDNKYELRYGVSDAFSVILEESDLAPSGFIRMHPRDEEYTNLDRVIERLSNDDETSSEDLDILLSNHAAQVNEIDRLRVALENSKRLVDSATFKSEQGEVRAILAEAFKIMRDALKGGNTE